MNIEQREQREQEDALRLLWLAGGWEAETIDNQVYQIIRVDGEILMIPRGVDGIRCGTTVSSAVSPHSYDYIYGGATYRHAVEWCWALKNLCRKPPLQQR